MIKNYNIFLLEKISLEDIDVINIIKSLETGENKDTLLKKLVNNVDTHGRSILMSAVKSNDEKLIDYILKFNPDLNHKNKYGENVLFYCKNIKIFKKMYDLGADPLTISEGYGRNILLHLANKKIFNVEVYQQLIDDGVNINNADKNGYSLLQASITNNKIVQFLIKKGVNINDIQTQIGYLYALLKSMEYSKRTYYDVWDTLFKNGLKINDIEYFVDALLDIDTTYGNNPNLYKSIDFITRYLNYLGSDFLIKIFNKKSYYANYEGSGNVLYLQKLLEATENPDLYFAMKKYFGVDKFKEYFSSDKYKWLDDSGKYNL